MKLIFFPILILVYLSSSWSASADSVAIFIRVHSSTNPTMGVPSKIFRKKLPDAEVPIKNTDDNGTLRWLESECAPQVLFRAEPLQPVAYPIVGEKWEQCRPDGPILFSMTPSGLSKIALKLLEGFAPEEFSVPSTYQPILYELSKAQEEGQWGIVAKLGSQMAAQFRAVDMQPQANVFAEIALATTAIHAAENTQWDSTSTFITKSEKGIPALTNESKKAVEAFQKDCGLQGDGIVGWKTMSCLPGGRGYTLPEALVTMPVTNANKF